MNHKKPELASLELAAVIKELQALKNGKIDQIYQSEEYDFFIQVHAKGKELLRIKPGKFMYQAQHKPFMASPTIFCMRLRKYLNGSIINAIEQIGAQRIVRIETSGAILYIELFSQGNVILCEAGNKIVGLLHARTTSTRELKTGVEYAVPPLETDIFSLSQKIIDDKIKTSKKDKIVTALATEFGLGGLYAEEACARAGINKDKSPKDLAAKEKTSLYQQIEQMIEEVKSPKGCLFENGIMAPLHLINEKKINELPTFNEALDLLLSKTKAELEKEKNEVVYDQKKESLQRILNEQQERLKEVEAESEKAAKQGDWFYEHYQEVHSLLEKIKEVQKKEGWKGVELFLKRLKKIKRVDLKEKKVILEL